MRRDLAATLVLPWLALLLAGSAEAQRARAPGQAAPVKPAAGKVVTCGALSNLRILMAETGGSPEAIRTRLADPKADHLGCTQVDRGRIEGNAERVVVGGTAYDCLRVKETSLCRWAVSGVPAEAP